MGFGMPTPHFGLGVHPFGPLSWKLTQNSGLGFRVQGLGFRLRVWGVGIGGQFPQVAVYRVEGLGSQSTA